MHQKGATPGALVTCASLAPGSVTGNAMTAADCAVSLDASKPCYRPPSPPPRAAECARAADCAQAFTYTANHLRIFSPAVRCSGHTLGLLRPHYLSGKILPLEPQRCTTTHAALHVQLAVLNTAIPKLTLSLLRE